MLPVFLDVVGPILALILSLFAGEGEAGKEMPAWEDTPEFARRIVTGEIDGARLEFERQLQGVLGDVALGLVEKLFPAVAAVAFLDAALAAEGRTDALLRDWVGRGWVRAAGIRAQVAPELTRVLASQEMDLADRPLLERERDSLRGMIRMQVEREQRLRGR